MKPDEYVSQWTLYGNPSDYRDKFVVRESRLYGDGRIVAQRNARVFPDEDKAHAWADAHDLGAYLTRMEGDDPVIIGVWV